MRRAIVVGALAPAGPGRLRCQPRRRDGHGTEIAARMRALFGWPDGMRSTKGESRRVARGGRLLATVLATISVVSSAVVIGDPSMAGAALPSMQGERGQSQWPALRDRRRPGGSGWLHAGGCLIRAVRR